MRNISICYFFFKGRVDAGGGMIIEHCPTEEMWGGILRQAIAGKQVQEVQVGNISKFKGRQTITTKEYVGPQGLQLR